MNPCTSKQGMSLWQRKISPTQSTLILPKLPHVHYRGCGQNLSNFLPAEKLQNLFIMLTILLFEKVADFNIFLSNFSFTLKNNNYRIESGH